MDNPLPLFRKVAHAEGWSFVLLLGVAMPLKYFADLPLAVQIAGSAHGALFVWFLVCWQQTRVAAQWPTRRALRVLAAALLPFGPFFVDRDLRPN